MLHKILEVAELNAGSPFPVHRFRLQDWLRGSLQDVLKRNRTVAFTEVGGTLMAQYIVRRTGDGSRLGTVSDAGRSLPTAPF